MGRHQQWDFSAFPPRSVCSLWSPLTLRPNVLVVNEKVNLMEQSEIGGRKGKEELYQV